MRWVGGASGWGEGLSTQPASSCTCARPLRTSFYQPLFTSLLLQRSLPPRPLTKHPAHARPPRACPLVQAHLVHEVRDLAEIRHFCNHKLGVSERQLATITWPEVAHRLVQVGRRREGAGGLCVCVCMGKGDTAWCDVSAPRDCLFLWHMLASMELVLQV